MKIWNLNTPKSKIWNLKAPKSKTFWVLTWYHKWKIPQLTSCTQTLFHVKNYWKHCIKLRLGCVFKVYMKYKWIFCLELGSILRISHYIYIYIHICKYSKIWKNVKSEIVIVPSIFDKGYSTCIIEWLAGDIANN